MWSVAAHAPVLQPERQVERRVIQHRERCSSEHWTTKEPTVTGYIGVKARMAHGMRLSN